MDAQGYIGEKASGSIGVHGGGGLIQSGDLLHFQQEMVTRDGSYIASWEDNG